MNKELYRRKLWEEICKDIENINIYPLTPILTKCFRLAKLCENVEYQALFMLHLEGFKDVAIDGLNVNVFPKLEEDRNTIFDAYRNDRMLESGDIRVHPLPVLDSIISQNEKLRQELDKEEIKLARLHDKELFDIQKQLDKDLESVKRIYGKIINRIGLFLADVQDAVFQEKPETSLKRVFIGHGRSEIWKDLRDFLAKELRLPWDEFERCSPAGMTIKERLEEMLMEACFAFLILTSEDEQVGGVYHARQNVIHEVGLFQAKLGFRKSIILVEEGCKDFSNIQGVVQIRFPKGNILTKSDQIRKVLEREGVFSSLKTAPNLNIE